MTVLYFYDNSFAHVRRRLAGKSTVVDSVTLRCLRKMPSGMTIVIK